MYYAPYWHCVLHGRPERRATERVSVVRPLFAAQ